MIYISSQAGRQLAKAKAELSAAGAAFNVSGEDHGDTDASRHLDAARQKFHAAAIAVADELMADRHHEVEGD